MTATLHLGDSRTLHTLIDEPIHCILTDPPYGVAFRSNSAKTAKGKKWVDDIHNDEDLDVAIELFMEVMTPLVAKTVEHCDMYVFTSWKVMQPWIETVNSLEGFEVKNVLCWDKQLPGMGDTEGNWQQSFELILYAKKGRRSVPYRRHSVISVQRPDKDNHVHPTEKPVALLEILLDVSTNRGDLVVDPFAGSGSTLLAATRTGRRAIGMELSAEFHQRASRRLNQNFFDLGV